MAQDYGSTSAPEYKDANPNQDPAYLAFLRGAGMEKSTAQAAAARQKANLQSQLEAQRPVWAQTLEQGLGRVLNNAAGAGTVRSGRRLEDQANVQADVGRQQASAESQVANQTGDINANLQSQMAQIARQQAEQALAARNNVYDNQLGQYQNNLVSQYLSPLQGIQGNVTDYYISKLLNGAQ